MIKSTSPEKRRAWEEKIEQQRSSGQPVTRWCKENGVTIRQFYYWKDQFSSQPLERSQFLELRQPENVGVKIECRGVHIHLAPDFDAPTLKRFLCLLRDLPC
jgi:hypothetical protein